MQDGVYKWVQVITSVTTSGQIIQLIGTTSSTDKHQGLDKLILRHRTQIHQSGQDVLLSTVCFMNSKGEMSHEAMPI